MQLCSAVTVGPASGGAEWAARLAVLRLLRRLLGVVAAGAVQPACAAVLREVAEAMLLPRLLSAAGASSPPQGQPAAVAGEVIALSLLLLRTGTDDDAAAHAAAATSPSAARNALRGFPCLLAQFDVELGGNATPTLQFVRRRAHRLCAAVCAMLPDLSEEGGATAVWDGEC